MSDDLFDLAIAPDEAPAPMGADDLDLAIPLAEPEPSSVPAVLPLVELLPADFKLPVLTKFVPNPALKQTAWDAASYALGVAVDGAEGLQRSDMALQALRTSQKAISDMFAEPCEVANALHKRLTGLRAEWLVPGEEAIKTVGGRMYTEQRRLKAIEDEARRKAQEEADRQERERLKKEAEAAAKAQAPAQVVEALREQAKTATAPPVQAATTYVPPLRGSTATSTWKARLAGTPGSDEPNPETDQLTPAQREQLFVLLRAILDGKAPLATVDIAWAYLNKRAKAEKSTLAIPGIEAFEDGGMRAKGVRR